MCVTAAKISFFCVWLWIFRYSVLSFLIPPNYYFCFPFKNSLSKLIWLIIVSNPVKLALLEHNVFLIWSLSYLDLHLSGYWFLRGNQFFPLSVNGGVACDSFNLDAATFWPRCYKEHAWVAGVRMCWGFFALWAWFGEAALVCVGKVWVAGHKPDSMCEITD